MDTCIRSTAQVQYPAPPPSPLRRPSRRFPRPGPPLRWASAGPSKRPPRAPGSSGSSSSSAGGGNPPSPPSRSSPSSPPAPSQSTISISPQEAAWLASLRRWATAIVARLGLQPADREDAVQEAFARVAVEWAGFVASGDLPADTARRRWIAGILVRVARRLRGKVDRLRDRVPYPLERVTNVVGTPSHEGPVAAREVLRGLEGETTEVRWRIWVSHEVDGVSVAGIARRDGLAIATVYNHLRLARRDLAAALGRDAATGTGPLVRRGLAADKKPR